MRTGGGLCLRFGLGIASLSVPRRQALGFQWVVFVAGLMCLRIGWNGARLTVRRVRPAGGTFAPWPFLAICGRGFLSFAVCGPQGCPADPGVALEPELTPALLVEFPAGRHEAVVECRFRFGITDAGMLCDLMTGNSLPALPDGLRQIGAASDRSVERLVAEYSRLVAGEQPAGYLPAAGIEEFG